MCYVLLWFCCASGEINSCRQCHLVALNKNVPEWTPYFTFGQLTGCIYKDGAHTVFPMMLLILIVRSSRDRFTAKITSVSQCIMGFDGVWGAASNPAKLLSRDGRGLVSPLDGALLADDELVDRHGDRRGDRLFGE